MNLLDEYQASGFGIVILQNDSTGIARQSNSIINYFKKTVRNPKYSTCNDDIRFEKLDGITYYNSMICSGFDHLVYFNQNGRILQDDSCLNRPQVLY